VLCIAHRVRYRKHVCDYFTYIPNAFSWKSGGESRKADSNGSFSSAPSDDRWDGLLVEWRLGCRAEMPGEIPKNIHYVRYKFCFGLLWIQSKSDSSTTKVCLYKRHFFFLVGWIWFHLVLRPLLPAPDDRWGWMWRNWWNEDWQGKPKYSEKTYPSATLSHHKSHMTRSWLEPGSPRWETSD
jgi:hypothetical protein